MSTKISWVINPDGTPGETWNPVSGCTKVSPGCAHCYAEGIAKRFWGSREFGDVQCHEDRLEQPLHWKKPRSIFVNSMSDLFHRDVPMKFIDRVLDIISACPRHTFMVLTKRPELISEKLYDHAGGCCGRDLAPGDYYPNLWLGTSVEDQQRAERIPDLLRATYQMEVHFLSVEPMLRPVDVAKWLGGSPAWTGKDSGLPRPLAAALESMPDLPAVPGIDWVICGCESGPSARPMDIDWVRSLRDQCVAAGTPFFLKQMMVDGKLVHMPELDGRVWDQRPQPTDTP